MPKACLNCGTENRDEALFCRRCGTPFSAEHASPSTSEPTMPGTRAPAVAQVPSASPAPVFPSPSSSVFDADDDEERTVLSSACPACGFANRPGTPACARCGTALTATAEASSSTDHAATVVVPRSPGASGTAALPPNDQTTVAFVPSGSPAGPAAVSSAGVAVPPGPLHEHAAPSTASVGGGASGARRPADGRPIGLWLAIAAAAVLLIVAAYWFLNPPTPEPTAIQDTPAPPASVPASRAPVAETPPAPAVAPTPLPASAPEAAASTSAPAPLAAASAAASAAEDAVKAAKEKADRLARAKALREQREQAAAAKKAEQDAAAQRAAEEKALAAASAAPAATRSVAPVAPSTPVQSAQEKCAGRGAIGTAVCESRECGKPEHVNEARCRQVNAEEAGRR